MTFEMQAVSGIADIGPMTFGELLRAFQAKIDFEWGRQASLMAHIGNRAIELGRVLSRGAFRRRGFKSEDFYRPQLRHNRRKPTATVERLHDLKALCIQKV